MSYEGVKYKTIRLDTKVPDHPWLPELQKWCVIFDKKNLAPHYQGGSHGNLSFRTFPGGEAFIITAAKSSLKESTTSELFLEVTRVEPEKNLVYASGALNKEPSSEAMLHDSIYKRKPEIMAILHGHCKEITSNADKAGIVTTREFVESGTLKIIESVMEVLDDHLFIEIKDHGFLSLGKTIEEAGELALQMMQKASSLK
jgi:ribulose-5-phosphate 4-epimerase/fuculose-1-phosphate aldolase